MRTPLTHTHTPTHEYTYALAVHGAMQTLVIIKITAVATDAVAAAVAKQ